MKTLFALIFIVLLSVCCSAQPGNGFQLPGSWDRDFIISLSFSASMSGGYTRVRFTYDSCIYESSSGHKKPITKIHLMKQQDREAILYKLRELRVESIRSKGGVYAVHDGWSESVCFGFHCIEAGPGAEMSDKHREMFSSVYQYLEGYIK